MTLSESLAECQRQFNEAQIGAVIEEFYPVSKTLEERSLALQDKHSSEDIRKDIEKWQEQAKDAPEAMKKHLEAGIKNLEKECAAQLAAEKGLAENHLTVTLVWNSSNGDRELMLPLCWNNSYETAPNGSLLQAIYTAASRTIIELDTAAGPEKWHDYTKIVTRNVAKNPNINTLSADEIKSRIYALIDADLERANIDVIVTNSRIKTDADYTPAKKQRKARANSGSKPASFEEIKGLVNLVDSYKAGELLGIGRVSVTRKVGELQLHGFRQGKHVYIPEHDVITYMFSHAKTGRENPKAPAWSGKSVELTDESLGLYKEKVGPVLDGARAAEFIGVSKSTVNNWLNEGENSGKPIMHGARHRSNWVIPEAEAKLCKLLYKGKAD